MKWNEIKPKSEKEISYVKTDVECPYCRTHLRKRTDIVLMTVPPKYYYYCPFCGFKGTNF